MLAGVVGKSRPACCTPVGASIARPSLWRREHYAGEQCSPLQPLSKRAVMVGNTSRQGWLFLI